VFDSAVPGEQDPNRQALHSISAVHDADPGQLNEDLARLRRFVRIRRLLYYSVLAPFAVLSRFSPLLVLVVGAIGVAGTLVTMLAGGPQWQAWALLYLGIGGLSYHAVSVRLAALVGEAAGSVDLSAEEVFEMWNA
jgi:hypothetical protein